MIQTIEIIISPTGEARIETKGLSGASCRDASRFIEEALGHATSEKPTSEFFQGQPVSQQIQEGNKA